MRAPRRLLINPLTEASPMKLWIGNINPNASDDDLRGLIEKYCGV